MDFLKQPFHSQRYTHFARKGMVATSQPLAAQAGLDILKKGGNAVDAAIATAAVLTVVEPTSNGIGGDAFAIVWMNGEMHGLNGSGPAPKTISIDAVRARGFEKMPVYGLLPITVPGVPASWAALSKKFGKLSLLETLTPAIEYAEKGFPLSPILGSYWERAYTKFTESCTAAEFEAWFATFAPKGRAPKVGEIWSSQGHADTLRSIGETEARSFYEGELAEKIDTFMKEHNGFLTKEDLASYEPEWVQPVSVNYRGYDVWEIPPNGHGIVATMALNIYQQLEQPKWQDVDTLHAQIEAMKAAFTDGKAYITEPSDMPVTVDYLLSEEYAKLKASEITAYAASPEPTKIPSGGTVYLATADEEGNMVSYIQSNYMGFGSGVVVPDTGIALQNRGHDFSLDSQAPNALRSGKRSYHTIIPGFLTKDGKAVGPFGVMGGYMQPQGHMQVVSHTVDFDLNPQAALDMPRWQWTGEKTILVEPHFPQYLIEELRRKGHNIQISESGNFGRGQIIWRNEEGVLIGGTESRTDGHIASY
ncbi:gamma-glutamyltransferase family protein [Metasolibacillus meyeri]|uniref:Gamma-glutamyltransferase family protein n=1 Tax=Metasolibacillus meyeri TaxID=1071052 RepID=A0AAW9NL22_9BACL|nr:gamma-glutamyltransferase family protein [Metasolibacillus meyeri]MEC1179554.1 gamma-glutamyltransferase family protein [Metasolibacillus meyeri]